MTAYDQLTGLSGNPLERFSEKREDAALLAALKTSPQARGVALHEGAVVMADENEAFFARERLWTLGAALDEILLGRDDIGPVYALRLAEAPAGHDTRDLRALAATDALPRETLAILAQAKALAHYHAAHRFCARCGALTAPTLGGLRRDCAACGAQHFPRTDPVAIMNVTFGDFCLLGRQKHFPENMYSCLAGFIEPGETFEEAVRRETLEESGVAVGQVAYVASQPWPFPASLMLGGEAQALSDQLNVDFDELEDCRWFSRAETAAMLAGAQVNALAGDQVDALAGANAKSLFAPKPFAIAHSLLHAWLTRPA